VNSSNFLRMRFLFAAGLLTAAIVCLQAVTHGERVLARQPMTAFPLVLGPWTGKDFPLEPQIVQALGLDDYVNRFYRNGNGDIVQLYIGYYASQRTGSTIHSPRHCLPGSGWEPLRDGRLTISLPSGHTFSVNDYLIRKGRDLQLVLYWYQARGRVIASEYEVKFWMVHDALKFNRTDGALVRVITSTDGGEEQARVRATEFTRVLYPRLREFIPN
jgi:EpsI family protein